MKGSSTTATTVALQRAFESHRPAATRLFCDPYADLLLTGGWRALALLDRLPIVGPLAQALYDAVAGAAPRPSAVARTRAIDDAIAGEIAADRSIGQVVILGAGFDSRAHRLAALRALRVFEVDHPATQATKRRLIARSELPLQPVVYVPVDFERDDLAARLRAAGLDTTRATLFLWEGVSNYLTAGAVDAALATVAALAPRGTLVFTYVHAGALDGSVRFPEAARWLRNVSRLGEPWRFGLWPDSLEGFLGERGYRLVSDESTADAGARLFGAQGRTEAASHLYRIAVARFPASVIATAEGGDSR